MTLKEEGDLAVDKYTYAGPKPQTKIAAIIMIADTIEAAMRAYMPDTKEEFEGRINKLVDERWNCANLTNARSLWVISQSSSAR